MQCFGFTQHIACSDQNWRLAWFTHLLVLLVLTPTLACSQSAPGSIQARAARRHLTQEFVDLPTNARPMEAILAWAARQSVVFDGWDKGTQPCGSSGTCCSFPFNTSDTQYEDVCPWSRICCSGGVVTRMDLSCYECDTQLSGPLPAAQFNNLVSLQELLISNHQLTRGLNDMNFSALSDMWLLDLSSNRLSEPLPNDGVFPAQLETLMLHDNLLFGGLPAAWAGPDMPLQEVNLARNSLTGGIPASWAQFDNLQKLDVRDNCGMCGLMPNLGDMLVLRSGTALGFQCTSRQCGGRNFMPLIVSFSVALGLAILIGLLYVYRYRVSQAHPMFAVLVRNVLPPPRPRMVDLQWEAAVRAARQLASNKPPRVMLLRLTVNVDTGNACLERVRSHPSSSPSTHCQASSPAMGSSPGVLSPSGSLRAGRLLGDASTDQERRQTAGLAAPRHNVSGNVVLTINDIPTTNSQHAIQGQGHRQGHLDEALPTANGTYEAVAVIPIGSSRPDSAQAISLQAGDSNAARLDVIGGAPSGVDQERLEPVRNHRMLSRRRRRHRSRHGSRPVLGEGDSILDSNARTRTTDKPLHKFRLPGVDALVISPDMESICFAKRVIDESDKDAEQQAAGASVQAAVQAVAQAAAAAVGAARIAAVRALSIELPASQPNTQQGVSSSSQPLRRHCCLSSHEASSRTAAETDSVHIQMPAPTLLSGASPSGLQQGVSNLARSATSQAKALFRWSRPVPQPAEPVSLPVSANDDAQYTAGSPSVHSNSSSQTCEAAKEQQQQYNTDWMQLAVAATQDAQPAAASLQPPPAFVTRPAWDDGWWEAQQTQAQLEGQEAASTSSKS